MTSIPTEQPGEDIKLLNLIVVRRRFTLPSFRLLITNRHFTAIDLTLTQ
jgi:hypothetical protein